MKVPNSMFQVPKKLQASSSKELAQRFWKLGFGISLELGIWNLEFGT
jgi:hypothetical protein